VQRPVVAVLYFGIIDQNHTQRFIDFFFQFRNLKQNRGADVGTIGFQGIIEIAGGRRLRLTVLQENSPASNKARKAVSVKK
jgi:hypothetical protein